MSWQNNRELQLGPNKTFKSKLWKFDDTIQVCNTNENELLISSIDLKSTVEQTIKTTTTQTLNEKRKVIKEVIDSLNDKDFTVVSDLTESEWNMLLECNTINEIRITLK